MPWFLRSKWIKPGGKLFKGNEFFAQQKLKHWLHTYPNSIISKMLLNSVTSVDRWRRKCARLHFHLNFRGGARSRRRGGAGPGLGGAGAGRGCVARGEQTLSCPNHLFNFHCQGNKLHSWPLFFLAKNLDQDKYVRKFKRSNLWFYFIRKVNVWYKNLNFWELKDSFF